tara:strand:+ start:959 stop:1132 length:174 start_codon:yes stop_codon:yes gene_type:complete
VRETAEILGIGLNSVYKAIENGDIPHIRIGGSIRVPRIAFEKFLECGLGPTDPGNAA